MSRWAGFSRFTGSTKSQSSPHSVSVGIGLAWIRQAVAVVGPVTRPVAIAVDVVGIREREIQLSAIAETVTVQVVGEVSETVEITVRRVAARSEDRRLREVIDQVEIRVAADGPRSRLDAVEQTVSVGVGVVRIAAPDGDLDPVIESVQIRVGRAEREVGIADVADRVEIDVRLGRVEVEGGHRGRQAVVADVSNGVRIYVGSVRVEDCRTVVELIEPAVAVRVDVAALGVVRVGCCLGGQDCQADDPGQPQQKQSPRCHFAAMPQSPAGREQDADHQHRQSAYSHVRNRDRKAGVGDRGAGDQTVGDQPAAEHLGRYAQRRELRVRIDGGGQIPERDRGRLAERRGDGHALGPDHDADAAPVGDLPRENEAALEETGLVAAVPR